MRTHVRAVGATTFFVALGVIAACSHSPAAPTTSSIIVTGTVPAIGQTSQLSAKATNSDGTSQDVTATATWSSSNLTVATVTSGGLLTVRQIGGATITATSNGVSGQFSLSLQVSSLNVTASQTFLVVSYGELQLSAQATLSNGTSQDVTSLATWSSSNTAVAGTGTGGSAVGIALGTADISATLQGISGRITLPVVASPCQFVVANASGGSITIGPGSFSLPQFPASGGTQTIRVVMTRGGSECAWALSIDAGGGTPAPGGGEAVFNGVTLAAQSEAGLGQIRNGPAYTSVNGGGNGTITISIGASGGKFRTALPSISFTSASVEGAMINGVTFWAAILTQAPS